MSRIGRLPVNLPAGVTVTVSPDNVVSVKGPLGTLSQKVDSDIKVEVGTHTDVHTQKEIPAVLVLRPTNQPRHRSLHGLYRALINNMVIGVSKGYEIKQELVGVGFKADYKKTGFSIWTGDLQDKQVVHAIFDSGNYTEKFERDLVEAEKSIVISSPNIRQEKIDRLLVLVKERQENGVSVTVITTDPEKVVYGNVDMCYALIREMQQVAIHVVTKAEVEERFAVIDDELVWHGGMNLLGKEDVWDNLMRIKDHQVAEELLEIALGITEVKGMEGENDDCTKESEI